MAAEKEAILIYKETQNYQHALDVIDSGIARAESAGIGTIPDLYATRCLINCKLGLSREAQSDAAVVKSYHRDGEFIAQRLSIHILLAQSRAREALVSFNKLSPVTRIDTLLKREILGQLTHDPATNLVDKGKYDQQYQETFTQRSPFTEFDF